MELRHLRYFIAVAEEGHITRAAERLGMQQPPLSQQIKALERELDAQLFHRKARGVELTDAGRALLSDARAMFAHLDRAVETAKRTARGEQGRIRVGLSPTGPFHPFVPRVIRAFRDNYPLVSLTLVESLSKDLIDRIRKGQIDAAVLRTNVPDPQDLAIHPLLIEPMAVALPREHPQAHRSDRSALQLKALAGETFIVYGRQEGPGLYDATVAACLRAGFTPRLGQEAPSVTATLSLVATGLGIALVPASLQRMTMDGVIYRPLKEPFTPKAVLNLASRRGEPSATVRHFINLVRRAARSYSPDQEKGA